MTNENCEQIPSRTYEKICKDEFQRGIHERAKILALVEVLNKRLFLDNGSECHQSRINRNRTDIDDLKTEITRLSGFTTKVYLMIIGSGGLMGLVVFVFTHLFNKGK